jgi:hypothetical protein
MAHFYKLFLPCCILLIASCGSGYDLIPETTLTGNKDTITEIREWLLIGPFGFDTLAQHPAGTFANTENKTHGFDENGISKSTIKDLQKGPVPVFYANRMNASLNLYDYVNGPVADKCNFYAYAYIVCNQTMDQVLVCDGSSSYAIWVNGNKVVETTNNHDVSKLADKFVRLKLKKGKNLVFAKINRQNRSNSWKLVVGFTGIEHAKKLFRVNYSGSIIADPLVVNGLSLYTGPYESGKAIISNDSFQFTYVFGKKDIKEGFLNIKLPGSIADGLYTCNLELDTCTLSDHFFYGDFLRFVRQINVQNNLDSMPAHVLDDVGMSMQFFEHYCRTPSKGEVFENPALLNTMQFEWGKNLLGAIEHIKQHKHLQNKPGTILKSFLNPNTGEKHPFLFHVAGKVLASEIKFPVIMVVLGDTLNRQIYQGTLPNNLDQIKIDAGLADEKGFAICWLFFGGNKFSLRNGVFEIDNVLKCIARDYPMIDTSSVFLYGEGVGGHRAILLAQMQPHRYAGLGVFNPFVFSGRQKDDPLNFHINLINMHTLIMQGQKFEGSPFKKFRNYILEHKKYSVGNFFSYKQSKHGLLEFSSDYKGYIFDHFEIIHNVLPLDLPYLVRFSTHDNSFNRAYWVEYSPVSGTAATELVSRYDPYKSRITLKCVNIKRIKVNASKLGMPKWKEMHVVIDGVGKELKFDSDGNLEILLIPDS